MAFTIEDFQDLVALLAEHPEWRAQLRPLILGEEVLQLPVRMDRVEAALEQVTQALQALTERMDRVELRLQAVEDRLERVEARLDRVEHRLDGIEGRMGRMEGRMGNIEGELLEGRYERHIGSWFSRWLRRPVRAYLDELERLDAADSVVSVEELRELESTDLLVRGLDREVAGEELLLAVEISHTVNVDDVQRAGSRADILRRAGYRARGFAGGYRATPAAEKLANDIDVVVDLRRPAA